MQITRIFIVVLIVLIFFSLESCSEKKDKLAELHGVKIPDYLPSWEEGSNKQLIIDFVKAAVDSASPGYIPSDERVALFESDGTLWPEKPLYYQLYFMFDRIKALAPSHKEWKRDKLIKAVLANDIDKVRSFGAEGMMRISDITQSGITKEKYVEIVRNWLTKTKHPATGKLFSEMAYQPMVELIGFLESNGFEIYIITSGDMDFTRVAAKQMLGIPYQNVIGSYHRERLAKSNGKWVIIKQSQIEFLNSSRNKPIAIDRFIGFRPAIAIGNADNDIEMLQYVADRDGPSLTGFVHHTDNEHEWMYDKESRIGMLDRGLTLAAENDWLLIDMKADWKVIYITDSVAVEVTADMAQ